MSTPEPFPDARAPRRPRRGTGSGGGNGRMIGAGLVALVAAVVLVGLIAARGGGDDVNSISAAEAPSRGTAAPDPDADGTASAGADGGVDSSVDGNVDGGGGADGGSAVGAGAGADGSVDGSGGVGGGVGVDGEGTATPLPVVEPDPTATPIVLPDDFGANFDFSNIDRPVRGIGVLDTFNREVEDGLGQSDNGRNWGDIDGWWAVDGREAVLINDSLRRSIVVTDMGGSNGEITSRMTEVSPRSGLVFRYVDRNNYWVVLAVPNSSTWNVKKIQNGTTFDVGNLGTVRAEADTTITIRLDGSEIEFAVEGRVVQTFFDETHLNGTGVGLTATGPLATDTAWADFIAIPRTVRP